MNALIGLIALFSLFKFRLFSCELDFCQASKSYVWLNFGHFEHCKNLDWKVLEVWTV